MSTSILYHAFGTVGYDYQRAEYTGGKIIFSLEMRRDQLKCASCGSRKVKLRGKRERMLRTVPIGKKPIWLRIAAQRVECLSCGAVRQVKLRIADARRRFTRAFQRYALDLCRSMTILDVARHLGVSWDVVKKIQKEHLLKRYKRPNLKNIRLIAIDEINIGKGHRYLTVAADLNSGRVIYVGDGKGADALDPLWKRLGRRRRQIEAVAIDMSAAYIDAVTRNLPAAKIVFDHFHVVKLFNEKLSALRRELQRKAESSMKKKTLKGLRWILLKNPENLDPARNEKERLEEAIRLNEPLAIAYYMKEDLRQLWSQKNKKFAELALDDWIKRANASGIHTLVKFAKTLLKHRAGILAYYDYSISTGPLEGINNKIKTMNRQAYGFRDRAFFKLKILALHETKYALVG